MADAGGDDVGAVRVRFADVVAGDDPDRPPPASLAPRQAASITPAQAAADDVTPASASRLPTSSASRAVSEPISARLAPMTAT